jgi:septal ring factor EnvC (AmiA/AmiB activator)
MTEPVGERLEDLEKSVRRAAEVIVMLRKERESLQGKLAAGEADRAELQKLRQERKEMLGQINAMLKEMEKLDL